MQVLLRLPFLIQVIYQPDKMLHCRAEPFILIISAHGGDPDI